MSTKKLYLSLLLLSSSLSVRAMETKCPLAQAAHHENVEKALLLLQQPDIDLNQCDEDGRTALHYATVYGNTPIFCALFENSKINTSKINVNAQDKDGVTPLMLAMGEGLLPHTIRLINEGANWNIKDKHGKSALDEARTMMGFEQIVAILEQSDAIKKTIQEEAEKLAQQKALKLAEEMAQPMAEKLAEKMVEERLKKLQENKQ